LLRILRRRLACFLIPWHEQRLWASAQEAAASLESLVLACPSNFFRLLSGLLLFVAQADAWVKAGGNMARKPTAMSSMAEDVKVIGSVGVTPYS